MRCTSNNTFNHKSSRRKRTTGIRNTGIKNAGIKNSWGFRKKRQNRRRIVIFVTMISLLILLGAGVAFLISQFDEVAAYEEKKYNLAIHQEDLPVESLCVVTENVEYELFQSDEEFHAIALFENDEYKALCAENVHDKIYPASTTKILTAYIALKYGDLSDIVTVGANAVNVPADSSKAWLKQGDQLSLEALLYGLMLPSGNDAAVAIAEYISGSVDEFAKLMNEEARKLGATNSNFVTPHGYQDENHYTTAYDLYLIFNQCIQNETFLEIVSSYAYEASVKEASGYTREVVWRQSNQYVIGVQEIPEGIDVVGGKTGTTDEAGACLIQYVKNVENGIPYIAIIMGADTRPILYENMTELISTITK